MCSTMCTCVCQTLRPLSGEILHIRRRANLPERPMNSTGFSLVLHNHTCIIKESGDAHFLQHSQKHEFYKDMQKKRQDFPFNGASNTVVLLPIHQ